MTADETPVLITPPEVPAPVWGDLVASQNTLLDEVTADLDAQADEVVLVDMLAAVRTSRKAWLAAEQAIETRLAQVAGVGQHEPEPGRAFVVRQAADRVEWDHDELKRAVVARAVQARQPDPETGEIEPEGEAVARAVWACVPASPSWRVAGLKTLGLDVSDYRTKTPGRRSVEIL